MSQTFSASQIVRMAEELLEGREFFVSTVADRMREAANAFPHDGAIRTAQLIIDKRASKSGPLATMSQNEFQGIYDEVCGLGNRVAFRELLGDLLLTDGAAAVASRNDTFVRSIRDGEDSLSIADPDLVESFAGLFGVSGGKVATGSFVDNGRRGISLELEGLGFPGAKVEVAAKNDHFVLYAASIQTNKGMVSTYIPAEIKMGSVLMPTVFVSSAGLEELTSENLVRNIEDVVVSGAAPHPQKILELLTSATTQPSALTVTASEGSVALNVPDYFLDLKEEAVPDFYTQAKVDVPAGLVSFTEALARDTLSEVGLSFDPKTVALAKSIVAKELDGMGIPCRKVAISSEFDGGLTISAMISGPGGNKTIDVPVEIVGATVLMPSVFASGVVARPFDEENLKAFALNREEGTFNAAISDKNFLGFKDLHSLVLKSASYGNFVETEEALAVIAQNYGDDLHKIAFDDLMGLLNVGFGPEEKPMDAMERYVKDASAKARDRESNLKMTTNLMYLHPED